MDIDKVIRDCHEEALCFKADAEHIQDNGYRRDSLGRTYTYCMKRAETYENIVHWLKDYKRLLAKDMGKDIKCGNCIHDGMNGKECRACYLYSNWEEV